MESLNVEGFEPKALQIRPSVHYWMNEYIEAFKVLSGRRNVGMVPNPIALSEIVVYASLYELDDHEDFIHCISEMDDGYLIKMAEQQERKRAKAEKK